MKYLPIFLIFLIISCGREEINETISSDPYNLELTVIQENDGSGIVVIKATAQNTSSYHFYPNDGGSNEPVINSSGEFTFTYTSFGSYQVEVRAYSANGRFIKKTKQIVVEIDNPVDVGIGYSTPTSYQGYELVWNDEFNGNALDKSFWSFDIGDGCPALCGWGNEELEYYREENCWVSEGVLTIEARKENFSNSNYTSGKIVSRDKKFYQYGRVDIRAKLPKGQGLWPALWMLGQNHSSVGWPQCGEIDIMEMVGGSGREKTSHGNAFWYDNGTKDYVGHYTLSQKTFHDEFHVFSIIWDQDEINWFVDDNLFHTNDISTDEKREFHKPFYFIMNVAVGGKWPGNPNSTTLFPTQMNVDYIRLFQKD